MSPEVAAIIPSIMIFVGLIIGGGIIYAGLEKIANAINIDEEIMETKVVSELTSEQIEYFLRSFEEIVKTEGPKIFGKLLFRKKFEDFQSKLGGQE